MAQEIRWEQEGELRRGEQQLLARAGLGSYSTLKLMACEQMSAVITCGGRGKETKAKKEKINP